MFKYKKCKHKKENLIRKKKMFISNKQIHKTYSTFKKKLIKVTQ